MLAARSALGGPPRAAALRSPTASSSTLIPASYCPLSSSTCPSATVALGQVLEESGQYDAGIKVLEEAVGLRSAAARGGPPSADLAASMRELANTHYYAGHLAVADSLDRLVLAI